MYIYMVFTTEGYLEIAIEIWSDWDLTHSEPALYSQYNFISVQVLFWSLPSSATALKDHSKTLLS